MYLQASPLQPTHGVRLWRIYLYSSPFPPRSARAILIIYIHVFTGKSPPAYTWSQTMEDISVQFTIPASLSKSDTNNIHTCIYRQVTSGLHMESDYGGYICTVHHSRLAQQERYRLQAVAREGWARPEEYWHAARGGATRQGWYRGQHLDTQ